MDDLVGQGIIVVGRRPYRAGALGGAFLAIAATNDDVVTGAVWAEADASRVLLKSVDDLPNSSFIAPSIHRQGDVTVAVSTAGQSPALAVRLRERIARSIGPEYATLAELLGRLRPAVHTRVPDVRARAKLWYDIVDSDAVEFLRRGDGAGAPRRIAELIDAAARPERYAEDAVRVEPGGMVYLVGAGPGDTGLTSVRGTSQL